MKKKLWKIVVRELFEDGVEKTRRGSLLPIKILENLFEYRKKGNKNKGSDSKY